VRLACQEHLIPGSDLPIKYDFIRSAGFDGIELRGAGGLGFRRRLPELRAARKVGVELPTVCVMMDHFIGDFDAERRRDALLNMKSQLSVIAELGGYGAITPAAYGMFSRRLPPFTPPRSPAEDRAVLLEALGELGRHAACASTASTSPPPSSGRARSSWSGGPASGSTSTPTAAPATAAATSAGPPRCSSTCC
jgi:sugar phosphate isomerase/epimerase